MKKRQKKMYELTKVLVILSNCMRRSGLPMSDRVDLSPVQQKTLNAILLRKRTGVTLYQKDIEEQFDIRRSTTSALLQQLEQLGYIERRPAEEDARLKSIELTEQAQCLQRQLFHAMEGYLQELSEGISEADLETARSVLETMLQNLKENRRDYRTSRRKDKEEK